MSVDLATARVICCEAGSIRMTSSLEILLGDAANRTLAEAVLARADLPCFASSAMDGWVVFGEGPWQIGDPIRTGDRVPTEPLHPGWARPISTGAPMPPGPGAILRSEEAEARDGRLTTLLGTAGPAGDRDIRPMGEEAGAGDAVLQAGARLTPPALALAAVCGVDSVTVRARPTVDLIVLGSEIVAEGIPRPGQVRDAYGIQLPHLLNEYGADVRHTLRIPDDEEETIAALSQVGQDVIITTGGSSHGMTDHVRTALAAVRAELLFDGVAMRPGHPTMLAARPDGALILCLPGNPLAAMTALVTLGLPILDAILGRPLATPRYVCAGEYLENRSSSGARVAAYRIERGRAVVTPFQGSGMLRGLAAAEGLAIVPPGGTRAGDTLVSLDLPW